MNPVKWWVHDPNAVLGYTHDLSDWLAEIDDTITSATWTVPDGLTLDSQDTTTTTVTAVISGGTDGVDYDVGCHIVTAGGFEDDRTIRLYCRER